MDCRSGGWLPVEPVDQFLGYLQCLPRSPNTVVAYAYDLRAFIQFLDGHGGESEKGWHGDQGHCDRAKPPRTAPC